MAPLFSQKKLSIIGRIPPEIKGNLVFVEDCDPQASNTKNRYDTFNQQHVHSFKLNIEDQPLVHDMLVLKRNQNLNDDCTLIDDIIGSVSLECTSPYQYIVSMANDIPSFVGLDIDGSYKVTQSLKPALKGLGALSTPLRIYGDTLYFALSHQEPFDTHQSLLGIDKITGKVHFKREYQHLHGMNDFLVMTSGKLIYTTGMPKDDFMTLSQSTQQYFPYQQSMIHLQDGRKKSSSIISFQFEQETHVLDLVCAHEEQDRLFIWLYAVEPDRFPSLIKEKIFGYVVPTLQCIEINKYTLTMKKLFEDRFTSVLVPPVATRQLYSATAGKSFWTATYPSAEAEHNRIALVKTQLEKISHVEYLELDGDVSPPVILSETHETVLATLCRNHHGQRLMIHNHQGIVYAQCKLDSLVSITQHKGKFFPEK